MHAVVPLLLSVTLLAEMDAQSRLRPQAQLTPGRGFYANLSKRLRCYWSFACLAELFYLRSNGRKLLAKLLLGVVTIFHFQRGLSEYCFDVFRVHSDLVSIKMRGVA